MDDHRQSGYSLFELVLTLAMAVIFATIATPSFSHYLDVSRLRSAAETIASDFRHTRIHAIQTGETQYINFNKAGTGWCYSSGTEPSNSCSNENISSANFPGINLKSFAFGKQQTITFSPVRGISRNGSLTLTTSSGETASIIISPLGRIRVCSDKLTGYISC